MHLYVLAVKKWKRKNTIVLMNSAMLNVLKKKTDIISKDAMNITQSFITPILRKKIASMQPGVKPQIFGLVEKSKDSELQSNGMIFLLNLDKKPFFIIKK